MIIQDFLAQLDRVTKSGKGFKARCPGHDDTNPSLSIGEGDDGRILVNCRAGCSTESVLAEMTLTTADLFDGNGTRPTKATNRSATPRKEMPKGKAYATKADAIKEIASYTKSRHVFTQTYFDAEGTAAFYVARFDLDEVDGETGKPLKTFRPIHHAADGWREGDPEGPLPLYRLPYILQFAGRVYVAEGEKAADALAGIGLTATTSAHGAQSPGKTDWNPLAGREVVILPDNDEGGKKYATKVAEILAKLDPPARVKVVHLKENAPDLPVKGDAVEFIESRDAKTVEEICAELEGMAEAAPLIDTIVSVKPADESQTEPPTRFEPFPVEILPGEVSCFVDAASRAIGCDPSFVALPVLSVLAAAIGNTRRIELKPGWTEPPILWTAIVGESGEKKTPAFRVAMKALRAIQATRIQEYKAATEEHEEDLLRYDVALRKWKAKGEGSPPGKPIEPAAERLIVSDTTVEALAPMLESNPRGLLLARDELDGWFGSFNRYANGNADAAHWLSMFNAETVMVDRKTGQQTYFVPSACLSISGGIQPGILARALHDRNRENGIAARFLFTMPPRKAKQWTEAEIPAKDEAALAGIVERLHEIEPEQDEAGDPRPGILPLTQDAKGAFIAFYNEHAAELANLSGDLAAAFAKLEAYAARLALVFQLTREPTAHAVDGESMENGIALVRWFAGEARRVYSMLSETDEDRAARELEQWIERKGGSVTARETVQCHRHRFASTDEAEAALETLAKRGCGRWVDVPPGPKGGRPSRRFELHNTTKPQKH